LQAAYREFTAMRARHHERGTQDMLAGRQIVQKDETGNPYPSEENSPLRVGPAPSVTGDQPDFRRQASDTAIALVLKMLLVLAAEVTMCAGFATPDSMGPMSVASVIDRMSSMAM